MVIELSEELEKVLTARANILGVSPAVYVNDVLARGLGVPEDTKPPSIKPFKTSFGILAKYGPARDIWASSSHGRWRDFSEAHRVTQHVAGQFLSLTRSGSMSGARR